MSLRKILFLSGVLLFILLTLSCCEPVSSLSSVAEPPDLDVYALAERIKHFEVPVVVNLAPPDYEVGHRQTFWLINMDTDELFATTATLRYLTPHAYMYVEEGADVAQDDLEIAAQGFESHIYPTVTSYFGTEWMPGVDNDPHLTILNATIPGVCGYFSSVDEYSMLIYPYSNQREMVYMNISCVRPGSAAYNSVLAHELQHLIHWRADPTEEAWVDEGLAQLAPELCGYQGGSAEAFTAAPDTQLNSWERDEYAPHY